MKEIRWTGIRSGDLVLDKAGREWTVARIDHAYGKVKLKDSDSKVADVEINPFQLVRRIYTAEELIKKHLGAEIIGIDDPDGMIVPATMTMAPLISSHLAMMHGVYTKDLRTLEQLQEAHQQGHCSAEYKDFTAHTHSDEPFKRLSQ